MSKILIIGDLHITDSYVATHNDYWQECVDFIVRITREIQDKDITHLVFTGDLVGLREKNFKQRDSLMFFMMALKKWNELTKGNVYSVIGNHDVGGKTTDFDLFENIGLIKTTRTLGCNYLDVDRLRIHLINYGEENEAIILGGNDNIAVTHADIQVTGKTTWWYPSAVRFELDSMLNWKGIEMIIAGHIHNPSIKMVSTDIDGKNCDLFYLGCPMRPRKGDNWGNVFGAICTTSEANTDISIVSYDLPENVFVQTTDDIDQEEVESMEVTRVEELAAILNTLSQYKLNSDDDIEGQIKRFSGVDTEAMNLALEYYENVKSK